MYVDGNDLLHIAFRVVTAIGAGLGAVALEIIGDAVGEGIIYGLWALVKAPFRPPARAHPVVRALGLMAIGGALGALSYLLHEQRILVYPGPRGMSLIAAPLAVGGIMGYVGAWQRRRGRSTPAIASFMGGALCAFAMAFTRYFLFF